jgi:hypothetical protein
MLPAAFDANGHGSGIDAAACLADFDATCGAAGFSGNRHATSQQSHLIPNTARHGVVFESGSHQRI